ncbi:uncharacterized membrane protein At1g75140-like [Impatiens glandulifera]|uniref:uncharacterized membrane protein At1g75140-like n=1 Tax=Impatiens glandulifera TaxID=253017 RepID=UPI001FB0E7E8|nr:uncharacterized membrane protein At1g75140-like [Impatiens glandulifera]
MANSMKLKGKYYFSFIFLSAILFSRSSRVLVAGLESDPIRNVPSTSELDSVDELNRQQVQIDKLEELVRNLSQLVSRLQSKFEESPEIRVLDDSEIVNRLYNHENEEGAVSVTKHNPFWSERFQFVSAVKLNSNATSINILPFRDFDGLSKYIAVGNEHGRVYLILRNGQVLIDFDTKSDSAVTSMLSYMSVGKNESVLITGHKNGMILVHRVWEASNSDEWSSSLSINNVGKFDPSPEINMLELHYVGRMRYIVSTDTNGTIRVFRENGTVYGLAFPKSKPLAFLKQRLMFLTKTGAGSLDLRSMRIRESECEGLNHSSALSYTFDPTDRAKAYGVTKDGDLIHVMLLGDAMNFKCRARVSKRKFDISYSRIALQAIRGYLLIINPDNVSVYNVSSHHYVRTGGPRLLFVASMNEIRHSFPHSELKPTTTYSIPLITSDREKLVVLSLGGGYVGTFKSNLPVYKPESNTILWTSPVLFFVLFLFGAWHFFAKKKDALTSWGPDDPFTSSPVNGDSSSTPSRVLDGGGGLRGSSRRYNSPPPRYSSGNGAASSFSSSSRGGGATTTAMDPRASEIKYRGTNIEQVGLLQKRRESLFGHSLVVENNNDRIN